MQYLMLNKTEQDDLLAELSPASFGKFHSKSACSPWTHLAVDHQPTRGLKRYHRRVGARAEVAVDRPRGKPLLLQRALDLAHNRPGHMRLGQPTDNDFRAFNISARIPLGVR